MNTSSRFALVALSAVGLATTANAAILLTAPNTAVSLDFSESPHHDDISTGNLGDLADGYVNASQLDAAVAMAVLNTLDSNFTSANNFTNAGNLAKYNSSDGSLYTLPNSSSNTGIGAHVILATLMNSTGSGVSTLRIAYDYSRANGTATEDIPGLRVYYSLTGATGSWQLISPLSADTNASTSAPDKLSTDVALSGSWASGSKLYVLWADDNYQGADNAYVIDNLAFTADPQGVAVPEPSLALLGGVSSLALLRRRRA